MADFGENGVDLDSIKISPLKDSKYIKTLQMSYTERGVAKTWEIVKSHDSVSILIYNESRDCVVLVRQFRPAVFLNNNDGFMYELCAGLVDKDKSLEQIAIEEVYEECGYRVENVEKIAEFRSSVGTSGAKQSVFFAKVKDSDKVASGGGIDGENISIIEVPRNQMLDFLKTPNITPVLGFAFMWFLHSHKVADCKTSQNLGFKTQSCQDS